MGSRYSEQVDVWQEQAVELPAYPVKDNLLEVDAGTEGLRYTVYLDEASLIKSADHVVRYTVVWFHQQVFVMSPMRVCIAASRTFRRYAYGINGQWQPLTEFTLETTAGQGRKYVIVMVFYEKFMCDPTQLNQSAGQILDRFRRKLARANVRNLILHAH